MRKSAQWVTLALLSVAAGAVVMGQIPAPPPWAYGFTSGGLEPAAPPCTKESKPLDCARLGAPRPKDVTHKLPDTDKSFTEYAIHYDYGPADWYPEDHPPMPDIVAHGRESDKLRPCSLCHYPNGQGKPENAPVAGLPAAYILQQLQAFRNGTRRSADPRKANTNEMIQIARHLTEAEMTDVATYFSAIKWRPWVRVVETDMVPKAKPGMNGLFLPQPGNEMEPLGKRILEVPENPDFTGSTAAVLGVYAEQDARVNASKDAVRQALEAAGLTHRIVVYPGAGHGFARTGRTECSSRIGARKFAGPVIHDRRTDAFSRGALPDLA